MRDCAASKRNGILSTELVLKELQMSAVDPERHIAVLNESREEIFKVFQTINEQRVGVRRDGDHSARLLGRTITVTGIASPCASSSASSLISIL